MPEVRRRRATASTTKTAPRRRDRAAEEEPEEDDDVDAAAEPVRRRRPAATKKAAPRSRRAEPEEEEEEDDDYEDEDEAEDDEEDEEEEEPRPRARKSTSAAKKAAPRRRRPAADDDEEEAKPRRRTTAKKKAAAPLGVHSGLAGAEAVSRKGGSGAARLALSKNPELIKVLEKEPFASYRQHWARGTGGGGDRPFTCAETDCAMCDIGDSPSKTYSFNILHFPVDGPPVNKVLQIGIKAYKAFTDSATPRGKENPVFSRDFWAVNRSGKGQQSQTNFKPVKDRDLDEDWEEIFDHFEPNDLDAIIEEAKENIFGLDVIDAASRKRLAELARYAADDDEDEDED